MASFKDWNDFSDAAIADDVVALRRLLAKGLSASGPDESFPLRLAADNPLAATASWGSFNAFLLLADAGAIPRGGIGRMLSDAAGFGTEPARKAFKILLERFTAAPGERGIALVECSMHNGPWAEILATRWEPDEPTCVVALAAALAADAVEPAAFWIGTGVRPNTDHRASAGPECRKLLSALDERDRIGAAAAPASSSIRRGP